MEVYCSKVCSCGEDIDSALESALKAVRIDEQALTEAQKAQVRKNIGVEATSGGGGSGDGNEVVYTSGSGSSYSATVQSVTTLSVGASFILVPHTASTIVAPKLNVNGLGEKSIRRRLTNSTVSTVAGSSTNWLAANKPVRVMYDGSYWIADLNRPNAPDLYGTLSIEQGGTGATTVEQARINLGIDMSGYLESTELSAAIDTALAQAKASGEFDGKDGVDGEDGHTPVKGVDYWTDAEQQEIEAYIATELAKRGQLAPEFANSVAECTDQSKMYVLPDGYVYAYLYGESEAVTYTNILDGTELHLNKRINSSGSYVDLNGYVSTDYLKLAPGDVVRVNRNITNATYDKNRLIAYNASKTIAYGNDGIATYYTPVTDEGNGVYSFVFGKVYKTYGNSSSGTQMITTVVDEGYMRLNIGLSGSTISAADVDDLVITLNEPISSGTVAGYDWRNTGVPFVPADYENRIVALEKAVQDIGFPEATAINTAEVFAPSPQLPADGSSGADFNAENMTAQNIYDYFDGLCERYPNYITKETLGKDASGTLDVNRYVLCRHYYKAWQRVNYPKMYAWVNGSTVIYSKSISPRIGDTLYTTKYIGTSKGTVSAVSNANQTRTVGGVVYTRDSSKDVEPTLVYTSIIGNAVGSTVYNSSQSSVTKVSTISDATMTGANGVSYTRYPMGDRSRTMERSTVVTIGANEHGFTPDPREPAIVCARLAKDLCECRNADNQFLNYLKNEVMLIIVPVINPYGFNRSDGAGYYNANGVNINRNYDCPGWGNLDDTGTGAQGTYGGSEVETQYFMNTISEPKSAVAVSVHALGYTTNGGSTLTHYQGNNFNAEKIGEIAEIMAANYNLQFTDYGTTPPTTNQGGKSPAYITWAGAVGGLIEMQAEGASATRNTAYVLEADYTLLLQCVNMWLSDYKEG